MRVFPLDSVQTEEDEGSDGEATFSALVSAVSLLAGPARTMGISIGKSSTTESCVSCQTLF